MSKGSQLQNRTLRPRATKQSFGGAAGIRSRKHWALRAETHQAWLEDNRYLNMELLREHRKEQPSKAT